MATLYDAHGQLTEPPRTEPDPDQLVRHLAAPTFNGIRTLYNPPVAGGLTPVRLSHLLEASAQGDALAYLSLCEDMLERDAHYASVMGTRQRAITGIKPQVIAAGTSGTDQKIAAACQAVLDRPKVRRGISNLMSALGTGYAVAELIWDLSGPTWEPMELIWRQPHFFLFDPVTHEQLRLRDEGDLAWGIPLPPYKFVTHIPDLKAGIPLRGGLARLVAWCHLFKAYNIKNWAQFLEVFGMPMRIGRYDPNTAHEKDKTVLRQAVRELSHDASAILPDDMRIDFEQLSNASGSQSLFERTARWWNEQISIAVLGQTMTSLSGSSRAQAEVHDKVRHDIQVADADDLEITLDRDIIIPYVNLNFGPQALYPHTSIPVALPEDKTELAQSVSTLVTVGLRLSQNEVRERFGFRHPTADEELFEPPAGVTAARNSPEPGDPPGSCPHCHLALNAQGDSVEDELDEIGTPILDNWEQQVDPLISPVRDLLARARNFEAFSAGLAALVDELGEADEVLIRALGLTAFMAEGLGNAGEQE